MPLLPAVLMAASLSGMTAFAADDLAEEACSKTENRTLPDVCLLADAGGSAGETAALIEALPTAEENGGTAGPRRPAVESFRVLSGKVTIDLNGCELSADPNSKMSHTIGNLAGLTILDSKSGGKISGEKTRYSRSRVIRCGNP